VIRVVVAYVDVGNRQDIAAGAEKTGGSCINEHAVSIAQVEEEGSPGPSARRYEGRATDDGYQQLPRTTLGRAARSV
jgi:hypothetical protein